MADKRGMSDSHASCRRVVIFYLTAELQQDADNERYRAANNRSTSVTISSVIEKLAGSVGQPAARR